MPNTRSHRGPHPKDDILFAPDQVSTLRAAAADLSWLRTRGYGNNAALKLVGDRYRLKRRQRNAVARSACSDQALARRGEVESPVTAVRDQRVLIDGFNTLVTVEGALGGAYVFVGRDGCYRDVKAMQGSYRLVAETESAIDLIGRELAVLDVAEVVWYLDAHVSNRGRLKTLLDDRASGRDWPWTVEIVERPDAHLRDSGDLVVTHDSGILDETSAWTNLVGFLIDREIADANVRVLSGEMAARRGEE